MKKVIQLFVLAALATTLAVIGWNVAMSVFIQRGLHLMPGVAASFQAMSGRNRAADDGV